MLKFYKKIFNENYYSFVISSYVTQHSQLKLKFSKVRSRNFIKNIVSNLSHQNIISFDVDSSIFQLLELNNLQPVTSYNSFTSALRILLFNNSSFYHLHIYKIEHLTVDTDAKPPTFINISPQPQEKETHIGDKLYSLHSIQTNYYPLKPPSYAQLPPI